MNVYLVFLVIGVLNDIFTLKLLNNFKEGIFPDYVDNFDNYTAIFSIVFFILVIAVLIVAGVWLYRSHKRLRGWGVKDLKFSDGSCVWWYFIPFMNLFKPYQAMRETWFASQSPMNWKLSSSPLLLKVWWGSWIISNIVSNIYSKLSFHEEQSNSLDGLMFLTNISMVSGILDICATILFLKVVKKVNQMQLEYSSNLDYPLKVFSNN
ncbi:hypothetical protein BKK49_09110 [Rodentibacter rarus]|nr:hypothetical protein BKK49_09110 [Rodentibacter rarus]OOF48159.1 hypothetical protein BKK53_10205 [Rodentibacter trehalosifermentans]